MTIKEIAKKYELDYHIVYVGLCEAGLLKYGKNNDYDENSAVAAVFRCLTGRLDRHKAKIYEYLEMMERINVNFKK